jgi:hypothetical protein
MAYEYCGSTSTREQGTSTFRGSVGAEATPTDFGNSDYRPSKIKNVWPFPPFPNPKDKGTKQPKFNPDNHEDAPI